MITPPWVRISGREDFREKLTIEPDLENKEGTDESKVIPGWVSSQSRGREAGKLRL